MFVTSFEREHFTTRPCTHTSSLTKDRSVLAYSSKWHHGCVPLKATHGLQGWERTGEGEEGEGGESRPAHRPEGRREEKGKKSLLLCAPDFKGKPSELLCVMFPHEGLLKHEMLNILLKHMIQLTSISRAAVCSLIWADKSFVTRLVFYNTTLFFKRTKAWTKNKAWPITPTACGDHMSMEPAHAMEKIPTHTYIHKYTPYTHIHVNHEN